MYLKIGNYVICDSETDGITKMLTAPTPPLAKESDTIQPLGSTNPAHIQRKGVSREIEISVIRQFESYRAAEVWIAEHMAQMERLREYGDLEFESMLGVGYLYGTAALLNVEVVEAMGVSAEIAYRFKAGRAVDYVAVTVEIGGTGYIAEINGAIPLWRVAKN